MVIEPFQPVAGANTATDTIAATAKTLTLPLGTASPNRQLRIANVGTATVFITFGVTATVSNGMPILTNTVVSITPPPNSTTMSYIGSAANGSIYATLGSGA